ncbi:hypothetical protein BB561_003365 [Smittium simulii]|uniref:SAGA-associated factor 11 n=1 Tax=Smittium simulii TaxID=133385 RepID=A0A2T9YLR9_9FUNG|nr:hypothetical protein BB561_003365 [Smittium simulii]
MDFAFDNLCQLYDSYAAKIENTIKNLNNIKSTTSEQKPAAFYKVSLAEEIIDQTVEDLVLEIVFNCHREAKQSISTCPLCLTKCRAYVDLPGVDIFGQDSSAGTNDMIECVNCKREYPYSRYAAHMDKCMGLTSRRTTSRRSAATSTNSTPNNSVISDIYNNENDKKRKFPTPESSSYSKKRGK